MGNDLNRYFYKEKALAELKRIKKAVDRGATIIEMRRVFGDIYKKRNTLYKEQERIKRMIELERQETRKRFKFNPK